MIGARQRRNNMNYKNDQFMEIVSSDGRRFIHFYCDKCKKWHTSKASGISKLRSVLKGADNFYLACRKVELPENALGLSVAVVPKKPKPKNDLEKRIFKTAGRLRKEIEGVSNIGEIEADHLNEMIDKEIDRVKLRITNAAKSVQNLEELKVKLDALKVLI